VPDPRHTANTHFYISYEWNLYSFKFFNVIFEIYFEIENKTLKFTEEHEYNFFTHVKSLFHVLIVQIQFISIKVV